MTAQDLERAAAVATAKLSTAEAFSWPVGILTGVCTHLLMDGWALPVAAGGVIYYLLVRPYKRHYEAAHDALERATDTGKYYDPTKPLP